MRAPDSIRSEIGSGAKNAQTWSSCSAAGSLVRSRSRETFQGRGDRQLVGHERGVGQQLGRLLVLLPEELEVLVDRHAGLGEPDSGLGDRQRKVAEHLGELVRLGVGELGPAEAEQGLALLPGEDVDLQGAGDLRPLLVAGGDKDLARAVGREEVADVLEFLGVVEDQQPVAVGAAEAQRLADGRHRDVDLLADRQVELGRQFGEVLLDLAGPLRSDPPDDVIIRHMTVNIFNGYLGFADPAHSMQSLRQDRRRSLRKALMELLQQLFPPGETDVLWRYVSPDGRRLVRLAPDFLRDISNCHTDSKVGGLDNVLRSGERIESGDVQRLHGASPSRISHGSSLDSFIERVNFAVEFGVQRLRRPEIGPGQRPEDMQNGKGERHEFGSQFWHFSPLRRGDQSGQIAEPGDAVAQMPGHRRQHPGRVGAPPPGEEFVADPGSEVEDDLVPRVGPRPGLGADPVQQSAADQFDQVGGPRLRKHGALDEPHDRGVQGRRGQVHRQGVHGRADRRAEPPDDLGRRRLRGRGLLDVRRVRRPGGFRGCSADGDRAVPVTAARRREPSPAGELPRIQLDHGHVDM
ncbi:hypothetical protein BJY14_000928 [Actinomadura luteofluorescens]|uniref:Uncharacterized protein n=1 Tax=Actinomadura luteofluorescens TaxID=46163 RepID=A0A7Y9ECM7_9ACTN|nr:hypothetical protein [Actinomadura luteofluorescens]NYD44945.1 hypothetical protein [Actinomadura luteofluorescens]